ncbi:hypothetical protein EC99P1_00045 [Enterococcus phage EC99P1]|nr:hypothetical protein EC99P1_00045 [Enterococcus phage EC99P1]
MIERIFNFEYLTPKENAEVISHYNHCRKIFERGLLSASEAQFMFTEKMIKEFGAKAFGICTNVPMIVTKEVK